VFLVRRVPLASPVADSLTDARESLLDSLRLRRPDVTHAGCALFRWRTLPQNVRSYFRRSFQADQLIREQNPDSVLEYTVRSHTGLPVS
jgi:hypothetical protein